MSKFITTSLFSVEAWNKLSKLFSLGAERLQRGAGSVEPPVLCRPMNAPQPEGQIFRCFCSCNHHSREEVARYTTWWLLLQRLVIQSNIPDKAPLLLEHSYI